MEKCFLREKADCVTNFIQSPLKRSVIKEELVKLTGDFTKAIILNQFIYWSERVTDFDRFIEEEKRRCANDGQEATITLNEGWIYKTAEELAEETMLGKAPSNMRVHITYLVKHGWILERTNPIHKWDRTKQYRVNISKLQMDLNALGYALEGYQLVFFKTENAFSKIENEDFKMKIGNSKMKNQTTEYERAIPEITYREKDDDDNNDAPFKNNLNGIASEFAEESISLSTEQLVFSKIGIEYEQKKEFSREEQYKGPMKPITPISAPSEPEVASTSIAPRQGIERYGAPFADDPFVQVDNRMSQHLKRIYIAKQEDYRAIRQLLDSQVPLGFILAGIDYTFANFGDRKINSFGYCMKIITQRWALEKEKQEDVSPIDWRDVLEIEGNFQLSRWGKEQLPVTEHHDKYEAFYNLFSG